MNSPGPISKRPRLASSKPALLDLPDELLVKVLTCLVGSVPAVSGRFLLHARHAYALALTCKRLHSLFRSLLHTIDARSSTNPHFLVPLSSWLSAQHLAEVARIAARSLRVCRLPTFLPPHTDKVLAAVADHCPRLTELAFSDGGGVTQAVGEKVFAACVQLRSVHVLKPGPTVLSAMSCAPFLRRVALLGISSEHVVDLIRFLTERGTQIAFLHIGFDVESQLTSFVSTLHNSQRVTNAFFDFLRRSIDSKLPALETLHVDTALPNYVEHDYFGRQHASLVQIVTAITESINFSRKRHCERRHNGCNEKAILREIRVRTTDDIVSQCLRGISDFISVHAEVSIQFPGAELVFPASKSTKQAPYFRYLQLASDFQRYLSAFASQMDRLETLDLGTCDTVNKYANGDSSVRDAVISIVCNAGPHLNEVRALFPFSSSTSKKNCNYIADVLQATTNVTSLELSYEVVYHASLADQDFLRMVSAMGTVEAFHMSVFSLKAGLRPFYFIPSVENIPTLLEILSVKCRHLKSVRLETFVSSLKKCEPQVKAIETAFKSMDEFEAAYLDIDAESVRIGLIAMRENFA